MEVGGYLTRMGEGIVVLRLEISRPGKRDQWVDRGIGLLSVVWVEDE